MFVDTHWKAIEINVTVGHIHFPDSVRVFNESIAAYKTSDMIDTPTGPFLAVLPFLYSGPILSEPYIADLEEPGGVSDVVCLVHVGSFLHF